MRCTLVIITLLLYGVPAPCDARQATTLAEQIASAAEGDTVFVEAGTYRENTLIIDRPLTLIGRGWPVLDGEGRRGLIEILADNVTVTGFEFRNTGVTFMDDRAALRIGEVAGCAVLDNRFEETFFGVYLAKTSHCRVEDNTFRTTPDRESNGGNAVHAWNAFQLDVHRNSISGHRDGIYLEFTEDSRVTGNEARANLRYGLHFMFSDRCTYRNNTFAENGAGVAVMYANDVYMEDNLFDSAWGTSSYGLLLKEIKGGAVTGNTFSGNTVGLFVESTDRLQFANNRFVENGWAIRVMADARDNVFRGNAFVRNTFDVSTNSRRTANSRFESNYWDRYRGYDLDRDGIGDKPFHPVRLYSFLVERNEPALVLLRSALVDVLDAVERVLPVLTPEALVDPTPLMREEGVAS